MKDGIEVYFDHSERMGTEAIRDRGVKLGRLAKSMSRYKKVLYVKRVKNRLQSRNKVVSEYFNMRLVTV